VGRSPRWLQRVVRNDRQEHRAPLHEFRRWLVFVFSLVVIAVVLLLFRSLFFLFIFPRHKQMQGGDGEGDHMDEVSGDEDGMSDDLRSSALAAKASTSTEASDHAFWFCLSFVLCFSLWLMLCCSHCFLFVIYVVLCL
jgi:hypothetical protein